MWDARALPYKAEGCGFNCGWSHWDFSLTQSFRPYCGPAVDSASNRNDYQRYLQGVKTAGGYSWQPYHVHTPIVLKSGNLNLLEPSGPVQACTGIALPLYMWCEIYLRLPKVIDAISIKPVLCGVSFFYSGTQLQANALLGIIIIIIIIIIAYKQWYEFFSILKVEAEPSSVI
jgi:hypothetical protein